MNSERLRRRQVDREGHAFADFALDIDPAAVVIDDLFADRQSQAVQRGIAQGLGTKLDNVGSACIREVNFLQDFARFETLGPLIAIDGVPVPAPFLRTHPYAQRRREDLARYLSESGLSLSRAAHPALNHDAGTSHTVDEARRRLLEAQRLYPAGSQSWQNIQRQLEELERSRR